MAHYFDVIKLKILMKLPRGRFISARHRWGMGWCWAVFSSLQSNVRDVKRRTVISMLLNVTAAVPAMSAAATNLDPAPQILLVTERGARIELVVPAGETIEFCRDGCFVTFPDGDKQALSGSEAIEISEGHAKVR